MWDYGLGPDSRMEYEEAIEDKEFFKTWGKT